MSEDNDNSGAGGGEPLNSNSPEDNVEEEEENLLEVTEEIVRGIGKLLLISYIFVPLGAIMFTATLIAFFHEPTFIKILEYVLTKAYENPENAELYFDILMLAYLLGTSFGGFLVLHGLRFQYIALNVLKESAEIQLPKPLGSIMKTPASILYYSFLLMVAGVGLAIALRLIDVTVLPGIVLAVMGALGLLIGKLLWGRTMQSVGMGLYAPGTLLVVSSLLQLFSLGLLSPIGYLLELAAYYMLFRWRMPEGFT